MELIVQLDEPCVAMAVRRAFRRDKGGAGRVALKFMRSRSELEGVCVGAEREGALVLAQGFPVGERGKWLAQVAAIEQMVPPGARERWILYLPRPHPPAEVIKEFGCLGFPILLLGGVDDQPQRILRSFARAEMRIGIRDALGFRGISLTPTCEALLLREVACWPPLARIKEEAKREHTSPRSYRRFFQHETLPCPRRLRSNGLVLEIWMLAAAGVEDRSELAAVLGLAGGSSVDKAFQRRTGRKLSPMLKKDDPIDAFGWFLDELARMDRPSSRGG